MADSSEKQAAGCGIAAMMLFVTYPMFFVMTFGVLMKIEAEPWLWVLFWCYVPIQILCLIIGQIISKMMD